MKRIFLASAAILGTALSAQAADLAVKAPYTKAPIYQAAYDWSGFYMGVNAGVGLGRDRTNHYQAASANSFYQSSQGGFGGGQIGYNWKADSLLGPIVYGLEADIQGGDLSDSNTSLNNLTIQNAYSQKLDWFGTVRGRIGLASGPVLSYVTAGYAYGNVKTNVSEGGINVFSDSRLRSGWTAGSGVEAALGGNWTGKIEYLYLNMDNKADVISGGQILNSELRENIFRVGLNYRINGNSNYATPVAANWTGFYLGGNIGSGTGRDRSTLSAGGVTDSFNLAPDGINGGAQIGYNWQSGNWVWGVETDFQGSSQQDNKTCILTCLPGQNASYDATLPWFGTVRGRLGYSAGSTLFYVTGGYAYGSVKTKISTPVSYDNVSNTSDGWTAGAGIETPFALLGLFGPNWTSKTEYLYVDLGSTSNVLSNGAVSTRSVTEHVFRTGLNYHFNSSALIPSRF